MGLAQLAQAASQEPFFRLVADQRERVTIGARRLGRLPEAARAYREALALVGNQAEERFLKRRLAELERGDSDGGGDDDSGAQGN